MFNAFEATNPRLRKGTKNDSPTTAGAAKVSTVTARSKGELEEWGKRMGLTPRKLLMSDINAMSSQELLWHESENSANYKAALDLPAKLAEGREIDKQWGAKRFWDRYWNTENTASPEEIKETVALFDQFTSAYPQFIASRRENQVVLEWLKDRHKELTFENLRESFEANTLAGKVWLNPNAINAGAETTVSGQDLLRHRSFHLLLQPQQRIRNVDRLSADQYLEANKDVLADKRTPPIIAARIAKAAATAVYLGQEQAATASSGSTKVVDYGPREHGEPASSDKYSFQRLLNSLSADEFKKRLNEDPAFADAVDKLNDGNK